MKTVRWWHPVVRQWALLLIVLLIATAALCASGAFWRTDLLIYDAALPIAAAPRDVVIVAVDDASVAALGRWPWRRAVHAALLDRLREMGAHAVALDLLFTESDANSPYDDAALAAAMKRGPPTVLPLLVEMPTAEQPLREHLPIPMLTAAAAGIGHVHLELDRDGVARSVFLQEGLQTPDHLHLAATLLASIPGDPPLHLKGARHPDLADAGPTWVRDYHMLIPFLGPPGHFARVSYIDVLRGSVSAAAIRGKLVLVGATAQGLGDAYPTPRSGEGVAMSGVEINANVLQALRSGQAILPLPQWLTVLLSLAPVLVVALGYLRFSPQQSLIMTAAMWIGTASASVLALRIAGWWWPPTASLTALLLIYPLWSWRRLEATQAFLEEELKQLAGEPFPLFGKAAITALPSRFVDVIERRIDVVRQATQRLRDVRRLLSDMIDSLPDATILVDVGGRVVLANSAAANLVKEPAARTLEGTSIDIGLFQRVHANELDFDALSMNAPCTVEAALQSVGRDVLVRAVPFYDSSHARVGTIIALADITELRVVQREREDVLRFLSHDMKSPASSLLGLAQLQRDPNRALPPQELSRRLDLVAQRLLALVDGFVALARAESADTRVFDELDLRDALQDAYDEIWATAAARKVEIAVNFSEELLLVHGDRSLLARAIVNLLNNAVKYSPEAASVRVDCERCGEAGLIRVADQGPGIPSEAQSELFKRFSRRQHRGDADPGGAGLGLAFVRVVADKHGGRAWVEGNLEHGSVFCLSLPIAPVTTVH